MAILPLRELCVYFVLLPHCGATQGLDQIEVQQSPHLLNSCKAVTVHKYHLRSSAVSL